MNAGDTEVAVTRIAWTITNLMLECGEDYDNNEVFDYSVNGLK